MEKVIGECSIMRDKMEVKFNKRDYLDDEFLDRIVWPHMSVYYKYSAVFTRTEVKNFFK